MSSNDKKEKLLSFSKETKTSCLLGFSSLSVTERMSFLKEQGFIDDTDEEILNHVGSIGTHNLDSFIENNIGAYSLPLGIATNFRIDNEEILIPMAIEESSVIAAASFGAKVTRSCGGFFTSPVETIATCQIQLFVDEKISLENLLTAELKKNLFDIANECHPKLLHRGGGVRSIELRKLNQTGCYVMHVNVDTKEAMGANIVNSMAEAIGNELPTYFQCKVGAKILTNLTLNRIAKARCEISFSELERNGFLGDDAAKRICSVYEFACLDPFRAATHNKGVMNGIDAVVIATGNDWRAVEAGCHAYASYSGQYKPLTRWFINDKNNLEGQIEAPISVGTVGGVTRLHPMAKIALKLLNYPSSAKLSSIIACVGLAQNFSAVRALGCEGLQKGHMALHEKNLELMRKI